MSQETVDVARRSLDAWNRDDLDAWLETGHPEIEWTSGIATEVRGGAQVYRGELEMRRFWDEWHSVWDLTVEVSEVRDLGDTVVTLGRIRTRGKTSGIVRLPTYSSWRAAWFERSVHTRTRTKPSKPWGCGSSAPTRSSSRLVVALVGPGSTRRLSVAVLAAKPRDIALQAVRLALKAG